MKICTKCKETKNTDDFYDHPYGKNGKDSTCKECRKEIIKLHRKKNRVALNEYDRKRSSNPDRVDARRDYTNRMRSEEPEKWREMRNTATRKYRAKNKDKNRAHNMLNYHVRAGHIKKKSCAICGSENSEAHHEDYSLPLEVIWLCDTHHKKAHKKEF